MLAFDAKKKYGFYLMHVLAWLIFIVFATLFKFSSNPAFKIHIFDIFFTYLPNIYVFYGNSIIFLSLLSRKKLFYLVLAEILFFVSYLCLYYIDGYWIG